MAETHDRPVVKLIGADGNAFNVMGLCKTAARKAGWPKEKIDAMIKDMMSGDYDHLLGVAMEYFDVE
jgi:hypothetical protein